VTVYMRPTVRVNEFGVRAFSPNLAADVAGHRVIVRDYLGSNEIACTGVVLGRNGYPSALEFTRSDGRTGAYSLFTAREIEVVS
jgi:hypothetical protein